MGSRALFRAAGARDREAAHAPRRFSRRRFVQQAGGATAAAMGARLVAAASGPQRSQPAASSDWPRYGCDLHNTRFNRHERTIGPDNVDRLELKWTFETLDGWPIQTTPAVVGDALFFGAGGYYYALDRTSGRLKWTFETGLGGDWLASRALAGTRSSCEYKDGRLYFGTGLCNVHCLDASTGKEMWKTSLEGRKEMMASMMYSPVVHNGKVFVGYSASMAEAACLDAGTGAVRWRFRIVKDVPERYLSGGGPMWTSGAIDEQQNIVINGTGNAKAFAPAGPTLYANSVVAHDADTGELLWAYQAHPQDAHDLDFCSHPIVFDAVAPPRMRGDVRRVVVAGNKANTVCLNRHTGELYWKVAFNTPGANSGPLINAMAVADNIVYMQCASPASQPPMGVTVALHGYTGDVVWIVPNPGLQSSPIGVANGVLYQGMTNPAKIEALSIQNGRRLWEHALPTPFRGGVAIAGGAVYCTNGASLAWNGERGPFAVHCFTLDGA